jgi:hypothetical protein
MMWNEMNGKQANMVNKEAVCIRRGQAIHILKNILKESGGKAIKRV